MANQNIPKQFSQMTKLKQETKAQSPEHPFQTKWHIPKRTTINLPLGQRVVLDRADRADPESEAQVQVVLADQLAVEQQGEADQVVEVRLVWADLLAAAHLAWVVQPAGVRLALGDRPAVGPRLGAGHPEELLAGARPV